MIGCLLVIVALAVPRILMFFVWLLTGWFDRVFETWYWPLLGFLFMPYTTLAYMAAMLNNNHQLSGGWVGLLIAAVVCDVVHWQAGSLRGMRRVCRRKRLQ